MEDCTCLDHKNIGGSFDDFLEEEGILEEVEKKAKERIRSCSMCYSKPAEKIYRVHGVVVDKRVCTDCFMDMEEPMFITVTFSDFTEVEYMCIRDAEQGILEANAEGVSVEEVRDDDENIYTCEWDVRLEKED
jgi:hypothetical protein